MKSENFGRQVRQKAKIFSLIMLFLVMGAVTVVQDVQAASRAGRIVSGWLADETMDNLRCTDNWLYNTMSMMFVNMIYDQLWMMGPAPAYDPKPWLADKWETTDGKTWRFHLRKDARFHDGKPVTAEDVAFTMEYLTKSVPAFQWHGSVIVPGSAKAVDTHTVEFTLPTPLGGKYPAGFWIPILPKHLFEPFKDKITEFANEGAIGSGPFRLKEFKPGEYMWFVANKDYWGDIPTAKEMVWRSYGSPDAQALAMKRGDIQMFGYGGTSITVAKSLEKNKNIKVIVSPSQEIIYLVFNLHKKGPIQNINVRKAIMHGIDRQSIVDLVLRGNAELVDSIIYPEMENHNPNLTQYTYDPGKAKGLLDKEGYTDSDGNGLRNDPATKADLAFDVLVSSADTASVRAMQMIAEQLEKIGIQIRLKPHDESTASALLYKPTEDAWDMGITGGLEPGPYGDWAWESARSYEGGGEGWNAAYYNNPEFDRTLDEFLGERNLDRRRELVYTLQRMWADDLPYGFLWRPQTFDPVRTDKAEGFVTTMGGVANWFNPWSYYQLRLK